MCIDHTVVREVVMLERMRSCLHTLSSHDALLLLRHFHYSENFVCSSYHSMFLTPELAKFDKSLHLLCVILNIQLDSDSVRLQDSLPVRNGGIGIWRSVQLEPSAYLAFAVCCS